MAAWSLKREDSVREKKGFWRKLKRLPFSLLKTKCVLQIM